MKKANSTIVGTIIQTISLFAFQLSTIEANSSLSATVDYAFNIGGSDA